MRYELTRDVNLIELGTGQRIVRQKIRCHAQTKGEARSIFKRFLGVFRLRGKIRMKHVVGEP